MTKIADPRPLDGDFLTIPEIAFLTNSKRGTVEHWRIRFEHTDRAFPVEDDAIGYMPIWRLERVIAWLELVMPKLKYDVDAWREHKAAGGFRRKYERGPKRTALKAAAK